MPFKSESQRRLFWAKVNRGEIKRGTAEEWESHTPKGKLPYKAKKEGAMDKYAAAEKIAKMSEAGKVLAKRIALGLGIGGGAVGAGTGGYFIGKSKTEKKFEKYPRVLARLAGMASRPGGIRMVASPQYYKDEAGQIRRKIGVKVTPGE